MPVKKISSERAIKVSHPSSDVLTLSHKIGEAFIEVAFLIVKDSVAISFQQSDVRRGQKAIERSVGEA
jgi:hypothetical protein